MKTSLLLLLLLAGPASGQTPSLTQLFSLSGADSTMGEAIAKDLDQGLKEKVGKDAAERPLFQITEKVLEGKKRRFMVIHLAQLGRPYLFTSTIERGTSDGSLLSTMMDGTFLLVFKQAGDKIVVARRQTSYRAEPGSAENRAIDQSVADQILAILPIMPGDAPKAAEAKDQAKPEKAEEKPEEKPSYVVVPADNLFLGDLTQLADDIKRRNGPQRQPAYRPDMSSIEKLASFPKNTEARVHLVFTLSNPGAILSAVARYSITDLPENKDFESRPADPRVGYFTTSFQNLGRADMKHKTRPVEHMINRWDLRKKNPDAAVSEVEKPVTFWIEDTVPEQYRIAVKAGILSWNRAFEAAGLKGALQVKEVDKDLTAEQRAAFDPADISYNMVRWFVGDAAFAIGPSRVNPMTGQILNASVSVGDMITRVVSGDLDLVGGADGDAHKHSSACRHDETLRHSAMGLRLLQGQPGVTPAEIERYQFEFMVELMAHEIGHNLGLRHNFKGSNAAAKNGSEHLTTSVMDYLPASIAGKGETQGAYYQTYVGPYDEWAIEYGYASLSGDKKKALKAIADRSGSDPLLAYGTDEDADRLDPDTQRWDSGADPLSGAKKQVGLAKDLIKRLEKDAREPGYDSSQLKERFSAGYGAYYQATRQILPLIGGMRSQRGATSKFTPVTAAEQREALKFLEAEIFSKDALNVSPRLLLSMGDDQTGYASSSPVPLASMVAGVQGMALDRLYSPATLKRLSDGELFSAEAGGSLTVGEMTQRVRGAVWSEIGGTKPAPENIPLSRRNLQSQHLSLLINVAGGSPVIDAKAAARRDLERIKRDLARAIPLSKDEASRLHMREMLRQAEEALKKKG